MLLAGPAAFGASADPSPPASSSASGSVKEGGADDVVTFGVKPSGPKKPDGRNYFNFSVTPGAHVTDYVAVSNYSHERITLTLRASDAVNTPEGDFALLPPDQRSKDLGTWIDIPASLRKIRVPARGARIVPFRVAVPQDASPGDHAGGITVTLESSAKAKTGQRYRLLQNVGSRMFVRVSGLLRPALTVEDLTAGYRGTANPFGRGRVVLTYTVRNSGNVALGGRQSVRVSGLLGRQRSLAGIREISVLLPGSSVRESVEIDKVVPQLRMTARVSISPLILPGSTQPLRGPFTAAAHFWAVPWVLAGAIALVIVWWRVRRRGRRAPSDDTSGRSARSSGPRQGGALGDEEIATDTVGSAAIASRAVTEAEAHRVEEVVE